MLLGSGCVCESDGMKQGNWAEREQWVDPLQSDELDSPIQADWDEKFMSCTNSRKTMSKRDVSNVHDECQEATKRRLGCLKPAQQLN